MMKSFWFNMAVADLDKAEAFYQAIGFQVASHGDIKSLSLPEGGNIVLFDTETFAQRMSFALATEGREVMISLNVSTREEVDQLVARVVAAGGQVTKEATDAHGFYGAAFTDLDGHHFNVIVM